MVTRVRVVRRSPVAERKERWEPSPPWELSSSTGYPEAQEHSCRRGGRRLASHRAGRDELGAGALCGWRLGDSLQSDEYAPKRTLGGGGVLAGHSADQFRAVVAQHLDPERLARVDQDRLGRQARKGRGGLPRPLLCRRAAPVVELAIPLAARGAG